MLLLTAEAGSTEDGNGIMTAKPVKALLADVRDATAASLFHCSALYSMAQPRCKQHAIKQPLAADSRLTKCKTIWSSRFGFSGAGPAIALCLEPTSCGAAV